jgi:hypothetical protein
MCCPVIRVSFAQVGLLIHGDTLAAVSQSPAARPFHSILKHHAASEQITTIAPLIITSRTMSIVLRLDLATLGKRTLAFNLVVYSPSVNHMFFWCFKPELHNTVCVFYNPNNDVIVNKKLIPDLS